MEWWIQIWCFGFKSSLIYISTEEVRGSTIVSVCIFTSGVNFVKIDGHMNVEKYRQILIYHAIPSGKRLIGNGLIFHQDNNTENTYLDGKKNTWWNTISHGLTSIKLEHQEYCSCMRWSWQRIEQMHTTSSEECWNIIQETWIIISDVINVL